MTLIKRTTKETDGVNVYKQILIYANLKTGYKGKKTKLTERNSGGEGPHWNVV